jgi:hypothetical protein
MQPLKRRDNKIRFAFQKNQIYISTTNTTILSKLHFWRDEEDQQKPGTTKILKKHI